MYSSFGMMDEITCQRTKQWVNLGLEEPPKLHPRVSAHTLFLLASQGQAKCGAVHKVGEAELDSQDSLNRLCPGFFSLSRVSLN